MPEPVSSSAGIAGIQLAAGTSSRMGSNKLLLTVDGESLVRRAARRALAGGLAPLMVVLGHQAGRVAEELRGLPCETVLNPDFASGITSSLAAGVAALPATARAAVVLLSDMPHVTAEMIATLVGRYRASAAPLVVSDYAGVDAPPMLYDRALFAELAAMAGGSCGKQVVKRHRGEAEVVHWPAVALADLDLPADYARLQGKPGGG